MAQYAVWVIQKSGSTMEQQKQSTAFAKDTNNTVPKFDNVYE